MKTECIQSEFEFQGLGRRKVEAKFDGGAITSDAGGLLLREAEKRCRGGTPVKASDGGTNSGRRPASTCVSTP